MFELVKNWMEKVGQFAPGSLYTPPPSTLLLRTSLIEEELEEFLEEIEYTRVIDEVTVNYVKELGDLTISVLGGFVDIGLDAEEVVAIIMENNDEKIKHKKVLPCGKITTDRETKARLKKKVYQQLKQLLEE